MPKRKNAKISKVVSGELEKIADQIGEVNFWRCVTFADTLKRYCEITMKKDDISPLHAIAMFYMVRAGGSSTPTHLAEQLFRSKHSVTKIIDNLEKEGFIVRDFTSKDRRVTNIRITSAGLKYVKNNQNKGNERARQVMGCLNAAEDKILTTLTGKLNKRMTDILEKI